ncbi:TIGR01244 family sulfur transferase [Rhodanobacter sp. L36]|uniref:TIGR01244 family sulfur transferase n=1 Tax=Rhodanobacter sp. L36 TaxID=1747221 RepID=UPI00131D3F9B|nr:TIGR01244 family sulfur transferase [Rhodanobacter sp. L36]
MQLKPLTGTLSVAPQIAADDLAALAALGFRSIVNNRPDGEAADQPAHALIAEEATRLGLACRHVPVIPGLLQDADVTSFAAALDDMPTPMLAFCRTGTRSTMLWALVAARTRPVDDVVRMAADAGYDLEPMRTRLQQAATP